MTRPLERIGYELEYQDNAVLVFKKDTCRVVIEMTQNDLEPWIGFAEVVDNDRFDEFLYVAMPYNIIQTAMEEAAYFASYVMEMRR